MELRILSLRGHPLEGAIKKSHPSSVPDLGSIGVRSHEWKRRRVRLYLATRKYRALILFSWLKERRTSSWDGSQVAFWFCVDGGAGLSTLEAAPLRLFWWISSGVNRLHMCRIRRIHNLRAGISLWLMNYSHIVRNLAHIFNRKFDYSDSNLDTK